MESEQSENTTDINNTTTSNLNSTNTQSVAPPATANVVTIPVPIVNNEGTYVYIIVKGSVHDYSCSIFGLNDTELQALKKRFGNTVKPINNGAMVSIAPLNMLNTLAELGYKVVCSCGEAEICWTMQREI